MSYIHSSEIKKRRGAYLPHWTQKDGIYSVTFRLNDSIPDKKLKEWQWEYKDTIERARFLKRRLSSEEATRLNALKGGLIERYLDKSQGECLLQKDKCAEIVANALKYFDNDRYKLFAWCVMPNHVHIVFQTINEWTLPKVMHSWKTFSGREINKVLDRSGEVWQREYYDHLVRDKDDLARCIEYVWDNPEKENWKWRWRTNAAL